MNFNLFHRRGAYVFAHATRGEPARGPGSPAALEQLAPFGLVHEPTFPWGPRVSPGLSPSPVAMREPDEVLPAFASFERYAGCASTAPPGATAGRGESVGCMGVIRIWSAKSVN